MASTLPDTSPTTKRARLRDRAVIAAFLLCLTIPAAAFLVGVRPQNLENRPLATIPPLSPRSILDTDTYRALDAFVSDGFPLRTAAVNARASVEYGIFRSSAPSRLVVAGVDAWLFYDGEVFPDCRRTAPQLLAVMDRVSATFEAAGKSFRFVIVPDKRTIYPEKLPSALRYVSCTDRARAALQRGMEARPATMTELWGPLSAARAASPTELYYRQDTHWNRLGAAEGARALVGAIDPGIWDASAVISMGVSEHLTDLTRLIGRPETETGPNIVVRRAETIELLTIPSPTPVRFDTVRYTAVGDVPLVQGRTLIVHDSMFGGGFWDLIAPWFADSVWLQITELAAHPAIVAELPDFDTLIFERVERDALTTPYEGILKPLIARLGNSSAVQVR